MKDVEVFAVIADETRPDWTEFGVHRRRILLAVRYGRNGGATCRGLYSGEVFGRSSGGNWAVGAGALADALSRSFGVPPFDGARGQEAVIEHAARHRVAVYPLGEMLWALPDPFEGVAADLDSEGVA